MTPGEFWAGVSTFVLGADVLLARGEADGDTFCEVVYTAFHLDEPLPRVALAGGLVLLWRHLTKRRPWLDNRKEN